MRPIIQKSAAKVALADHLCFTNVVQAGCPALPPAHITVQLASCHFYDASKDETFRKRIEDSYKEGWDNKSTGEFIALRAEALRRNNGIILSGIATPKSLRDEFFLQTSDPTACNAFSLGASYDFSLHTTCPMAPYDIPVSKLVTFPATLPVPPYEQLEPTKEKTR